MAFANLDAAIAYFQAFRTSRLQEYFEAMREYRVGGNSGYGRFEGCDLVVDTIRNIYHNLDEGFANLSIPGGFVTEERLVQAWRNFLRMLNDWGQEFDRLRPLIIAEGRSNVMGGSEGFADEDFLPRPYTEIDRIRAEMRDAVDHTLAIIDAGPAQATGGDVDRLEALFSRFHKIAVQLKRRHADRETLAISDEYDVQDLMHALLKLEFDDIRPEDYAPSYAGGASRIDFVLPAEACAIEVKMTRSTLKDRKLGEELIIDIARYSAMPAVNTLYCFIYDADAHIMNPEGLKADLEKLGGDLKVKVTIVPRQ